MHKIEISHKVYERFVCLKHLNEMHLVLQLQIHGCMGVPGFTSISLDMSVVMGIAEIKLKWPGCSKWG